MSTEKDLDKYLIIVSKFIPLTEEKIEWMQENFEYVPYTDSDGESCMETETFKAYTSLVKLMKKKYNLVVDAVSAYRSVSTQEKVYQDLSKEYGEEWAKTHVALPNQSEHHTGLALDLRFRYAFVPESLREQANSIAKRTGLQQKIFQIIEKEAVQFGFVKRYHSNKESITGVKEENWHFRYVGIENAKKMYETGMCLEEYVKELKLKKEKVEASVR